VIYKLTLISGLSKKQVNEILSSLRLLKSKFSDSPENLQSKIHQTGRVMHRQHSEDEEWNY